MCPGFSLHTQGLWLIGFWTALPSCVISSIAPSNHIYDILKEVAQCLQNAGVKDSNTIDEEGLWDLCGVIAC